MHPVSYLFEDIYRNDWGIADAVPSKRRRGKTNPWKRAHVVAERTLD